MLTSRPIPALMLDELLLTGSPAPDAYSQETNIFA
jgi:hypothetical protein